MKKKATLIAMAALALTGMNEIAYGGETSLAGYLTYWDGSVDGVGGGIKVRQKFLAFFSADVRAGYVDFSDADTSVVPVEATLMVGIPFFIEPYAGLGASYYFVDSDIPGVDNATGVYGVVGLQLNLWVVGALAELRWNETEEDLMDGMSANLGLMVKW